MVVLLLAAAEGPGCCIARRMAPPRGPGMRSSGVEGAAGGEAEMEMGGEEAAGEQGGEEAAGDGAGL